MKYQELKDKLSSYFSAENGFFFAFNEKQFKEGKEQIRKYGHLSEGEKLVRIAGGGFTTRKAYEKYTSFFDAIKKQIATECNPQEIYDYEYFNFESMYAPNGDLDAMKVVLGYFGEEKLKQIARKECAYYSIEEIINYKNYQ